MWLKTVYCPGVYALGLLGVTSFSVACAFELKCHEHHWQKKLLVIGLVLILVIIMIERGISCDIYYFTEAPWSP